MIIFRVKIARSSSFWTGIFHEFLDLREKNEKFVDPEWHLMMPNILYFINFSPSYFAELINLADDY